MMKRVFVYLFLLVILTGCWDERFLKEHTLILSIGYDTDEDVNIKQTVTFPAETNQGGESSSITSKYNHITVKGNTAKDTDTKMDRYAPETFDRSKAKVILIGEDLAKKGVFTTLDSIYRDLRGPLNAIMAVIEGQAEDALTQKIDYDMLISEFYLDLLESAHDVGLTKAENIQDICPFILTVGEDVAVPYLKVDKDKKAADVLGIALFTDDKMTGKLFGKDATIYNILDNAAPKRTKMNLEILSDESVPEKKYVDFAIRKMKRKMNIDIKDGDVTVNLHYTLAIQIDEFAKDDLEHVASAKEVEEKIANKLTENAQSVIEKMLEVNHDGLGIGQHVKAYHHEEWKQMDWKEVYPEITMLPTFEVKMMTHGIIN